jgi:hypothetical protein
MAGIGRGKTNWGRGLGFRVTEDWNFPESAACDAARDLAGCFECLECHPSTRTSQVRPWIPPLAPLQHVLCLDVAGPGEWLVAVLVQTLSRGVTYRTGIMVTHSCCAVLQGGVALHSTRAKHFALRSLSPHRRCAVVKLPVERQGRGQRGPGRGIPFGKR